MLFKISAIAALLTANVALEAGNVFSVTGPTPFAITGETGDVFSWTQASGYTNVTITMPFEDVTSGGPIGGVEGTVYLMKQVGPGTTTANQVAPPVSISGLTASFTTRTLFTGLTLGPGTYYIVLARTNTSSISPEGTSTPTIAADAGVADGGEGITFAVAPYPPASTFIPSPLQKPTNNFITVTGDLLVGPGTPAPSSLILLLIGLAGAGLYAARRKFARRRAA